MPRWTVPRSSSSPGRWTATPRTVLTAAYEQAIARRRPAQPWCSTSPRSDYINSTGIALIVSVLAQARAQRRKVVASGLSEHYREIFDITRLSDFIELFPISIAP